MNVAVLFDTEPKLYKERALLAGEELFWYSFRQCYQHSEIDCIGTIGLDTEMVMHYVDDLKNKMSTEKPVEIFSDRSEWKEKKDAELYLFHDIRYPLVTKEMIDRVLQKAAFYGSAVIAEPLSEEILAVNAEKENASFEELDKNKICIMKYPAAVRCDSAVFEEWNKILKIDDWLRVLGKERAHLCKTEKYYHKVCTKEEAELAEAIMKIR